MVAPLSGYRQNPNIPVLLRFRCPLGWLVRDNVGFGRIRSENAQGWAGSGDDGGMSLVTQCGDVGRFRALMVADILV